MSQGSTNALREIRVRCSDVTGLKAKELREGGEGSNLKPATGYKEDTYPAFTVTVMRGEDNVLRKESWREIQSSVRVILGKE